MTMIDTNHDLPNVEVGHAFVMPNLGKTFRGPRNSRGFNTVVYLYIGAQGRVEVKVERDGTFAGDLYLPAG